MTYENDVRHTDYITIEEYEVSKCFIQTVNIYKNSITKFGQILRLAMRIFRDHLIRLIKFKFISIVNIQNDFSLI